MLFGYSRTSWITDAVEPMHSLPNSIQMSLNGFIDDVILIRRKRLQVYKGSNYFGIISGDEFIHWFR